MTLIFTYPFRPPRLNITGKENLTLYIRETPKQVLLQTLKTLMKCLIMWHFIRVYSVFKVKLSSDKKYILTKNYNLTPPDMYNGLSQVYCIKPEGKTH